MAISEDEMMRGWQREIQRKKTPGRRCLLGKSSGRGRKRTGRSGQRRRKDPTDGFRLDLHGQRAETACKMLDLELNSQFTRGAHSGIVICGHGTGVLMLQIGRELAQHPLVATCRLAPDGSAAYLVELVECEAET